MRRCLSAAGALAIVAALAPAVAGTGTSTQPRWWQGALLVAGCDLSIAALLVGVRRSPPAGTGEGELAALLSGALADGVMAFALTVVAVIVVFGQSKPSERLVYVLAGLVVVPLSVTLAWRRWRLGTARARRQLLDVATLAATAAVLCVARALAFPAGGALDATLFVLLALLAARAALGLAARLLPAGWTRRSPTQAALAATPLLLVVAAAPFIPPPTRSPVDLAVALAAGVVTFGLSLARGGRRGLPRVWRWALDGGVLLLCTLVVVYLGKPELELATNHNYFLGPASDVLHGHPMLVGTFSQYGVGMVDALAAVFLVLPIGYGTFTLLLSGLTAALFGVVYLVLRWSTGSLLLSALGLSVAVVLYVFGQISFYATYPSTGVLRFGLPWLVVLCSLAAARTARRRRLYEALVLLVVAVAAAWSGEAAGHCLGTAAALACLHAAVADASARERLRRAARRIVLLLAASACGPLAFTVVTWLATGTWARWGEYLEYIRMYTTGGFGALPIEPWSPGLALGALYVVSAIALVLLVVTRPALVRERAVAFSAATGLTALGTLVFTYYLGRAAANNLVHVSPPAVALLFVWLGIARATLDSRVTVAAASAAVVFLGTLIVASESDDIAQKYPSVALAAVTGSAPPLGAELSALWRNPLVEPASAAVVGFVSSLRLRDTPLTILLPPEIDTEVLLRLHAANAVGSSNPCQESLSPHGPLRVAAAVRALRPGGVVILSAVGQLLPIQQYTLALLKARFTLQQIASEGGVLAFRTVALRPPAPSPPPPTLPPILYGCA